MYILCKKKALLEPHKMVKTFYKCLSRRWSSFSKYYTAGSKSQSTVSCAVWHPESQSSATFTLHSESSIYTGELYAIYKTTLKILAHDSNTTKYLIISDSKYALKALSSYNKSDTHHLIYEIKAILLQLKQQRKIVHLLWVPSHIGIDGNKHVDSIAANHFSHTLSMPILHSDITATDR